MGFMTVCEKREMGLAKTVNSSFGSPGYPFIPMDTKMTPQPALLALVKSHEVVYVPFIGPTTLISVS